MADLIGVEKCGGCLRGKVVDPTNLLVRECWGAPPTPCIILTGPGQAGQVQYRVEMIRPRVQATDDGCGAFKRRPDASPAQDQTRLQSSGNARSLI